MGKALRIFLILLGSLVGLLVIAAIVLPLIIDPNDYKGRIADAVREQTGRELVIEGDIGLSVFPWLGFEIGATRLGNAPGFGDQPFAEIGAVQARLKLLPLLRQEVEMDTLVLEGLRLRLMIDAQGTSNWADLAGGEKDVDEGGPGDGGQALAGLAIGGIRLSDAQVSYDDRAAGTRYDIEQLNLTTGAIAPGEPVDLDLSLRLRASEPAMAGAVNFGGEVLIAESLQQFTLSDMDLRLDLEGEGLPGGALDAALTSNTLELDLERQTLAIPAFNLTALGLHIDGELQGTDLQAEVPRFTGSLKLREFVPREVLARLAIEAPETADPAVLGKAEAELKLAATPNDVKLSDIRLRLDDSAITGQFSLANFAKPAIRFDLTLDQIDADRYLPPPDPDAQATPVPPTAAAAAAANELPLETLRALDVAGSFRIQTLKAFQLRSRDVLFTLKAKDGVVRVHPAEAKLYEGNYQGDMSFDVRRDTPRISMDERVTGVQAGPLLKDLMGEERLSGQANVQVKLSGSGATPEAIRPTLNGNLAFAFTDGAVQGFDLVALLDRANALLKGQPAPTDTGPGETRFTEVRGTATFTNGLVRNEDLAANSPFFRVTGAGTTHLAEETIDYLVRTAIVASPEGQGGKTLDELRGLTIPVHIGGSYSEPSYRVQLDEVLKQRIESEVKGKIEEQKQEVEDKLKQQLLDKLPKGLFR
ncbi:MAG: AsmA family protein [Gammaproteobacteria bacterium]